MRYLFCGTCLALAAVGCGNQEGGVVVETVPVSGILTHKGKPLPGYTVLFMPVNGERAASGITDEQGKFVLGSNDVGDGAPIGKYNIAVTYMPELRGEPGKEDLGGPPPAPPVKLPPKYGDPARSGISIDVPEDGLTDIEVKLE